MKSIIIFLDGLAPLIPIFYILKFKKKGVLKELIFLFVFLVLQFIFNTIANVLSYYPFSNYFVYHIGLPVSFLALLFFLNGSRGIIYYSKIQFIIGLCLFFIFILNSLFFEKIITFNSISYSLCSLYILTVCMKYFWLKANTNGTNEILKEPYFWFISSFFIYYCSSFIAFSSYHYFIKYNDQSAGIVWRFHNVMFLVMCILISKGVKLKHLCQAKSFFL